MQRPERRIGTSASSPVTTFACTPTRPATLSACALRARWAWH